VNRMIVFLTLVAVALSGCAQNSEQAAGQLVEAVDIQEVAAQLVETVNNQDVEGALALFAESAVVNTGGPTSFTGTEQIQDWLEGLERANFRIEADIQEVKVDTIVEQERLSMDPWTAMGISSLEGVSEIKFQNGLIQSLDFTFTDASLDELRIATLKASQPTQANIAYADDGSPVHRLDLYLPAEGEAPYPVIFMIHGSGDEKEDHNAMAGFFNQAGFAAVLIDYGGNHDQMVPDALCSLAWTMANADEYDLDPDRITIFGFSVGGLIASTLGTLDDRAAALQSCDHKLTEGGELQGVAIYEGVLGTPEGCLSQSWCLAGASADTGIPLIELQPIFETLRDVPPEKWKDGGAVSPEAEAFAKQLPLYWLDGGEPPFLIIHGSGEEGIPRIESQAFASRLEAAGVEVELLLLPTASHQSVYPSSPSFPEIAEAVVTFARNLGD
jgi:acetyl esterase/lipase